MSEPLMDWEDTKKKQTYVFTHPNDIGWVANTH